MYSKIKQVFALTLGALAFSQVNAVDFNPVDFQNTIEKLRQTSDACILVKGSDPFSTNVGTCYANTHNKVKALLNSNINQMDQASKVQYLNTYGAYAQLQKNKCEQMFPKSLSTVFSNQIAECKLKVDLGQALIIRDTFL
jgi:hypothetical protein